MLLSRSRHAVGQPIVCILFVAGSSSNKRRFYSDDSLLQNRPLFLAICPGSLWARDNRWLLSRVQRLAGPAGGTGAFCPGWRHQPGQNESLLSRLVVPTGTKGPRSLLSRLEPPTGTKVPPFVPVCASNRDKRPCAPYPLPSPPARAIQLTCFLAVLGSG